MDLSGKIIIKASFGEDIRRIPIHNEELTYDELILMMQRVFRGKLDSTDDVTLKYMDEDGDLITLFDSADVGFAIQYSRILKLTVFINGKNTVTGAGTGAAAPIAKDHVAELRVIRDRINKILDEISDQGQQQQSGLNPTAGDLDVLEKKMANTSLTTAAVSNGAQESKEFDPYIRANSVDAKGLPEDHQSASSQKATVNDQQQQDQKQQQQQQLQPVAPPQTHAPPVSYPEHPATPMTAAVMPHAAGPPSMTGQTPTNAFQRPPVSSATPMAVRPPTYSPNPQQMGPGQRYPQQQAPPVASSAYQPPTSIPAAYPSQAQGYVQQQQPQQQPQQQQQQAQQYNAYMYQGTSSAGTAQQQPGAASAVGAPPTMAMSTAAAAAAPGGGNPYAKSGQPGQTYYRQ